MWCEQKEELKEALQMIDGDFLYKLIVFCWMRGEGKSLVVCLIQMWKFFMFPRQQIVLGANSKDQSKFVHYDMIRDLVLNSPNLIRIVGKRNIQEKSIALMNHKNEVQSAIRSISSYSGIVSNITGYTFSEMFDMKDPKFFVQLDGSTRNIPLALGTIDSTVSTKEHVLYRLFKSYEKGTDEALYFSHRSSPKADYRDFWHPRMTQKQLTSYKSRFPPAEFERYFKNSWELSTGKLFTPEIVELVNSIGIDSEIGFSKILTKKITKTHEKVLSLRAELEKVNRRNRRVHSTKSRRTKKSKRTKNLPRVTARDFNVRAGNKKTGAKRSQKAIDQDISMTILNEIDSNLDRIIRVDEVYTLSNNGLPSMVSYETLKKLGETFDTNWAIQTGLDRSDPLSTTSSARTMLVAAAKGAVGSKTRYKTLQHDKNSIEYINILLHVSHIQDASLRGIKDELQAIHDEYDGIDTFCSERWGVWDLQDWCEEMDISFEAVFPSYTLQKAAFTELYQACARGLFKAPIVFIAGSKEDNILREEMRSFDYDPERKWYGSPQKNESGGIQDDCMFALALCLYGGRELSLDDLRELQSMKEMFGIFYSPQNNRRQKV
jgi:hypothetical protein